MCTHINLEGDAYSIQHVWEEGKIRKPCLDIKKKLPTQKKYVSAYVQIYEVLFGDIDYRVQDIDSNIRVEYYWLQPAIQQNLGHVSKFISLKPTFEFLK